MDGVNMEVNALVTGAISINGHDPSYASILKVAAHSVDSAITQQLFKLLADMLAWALQSWALHGRKGGL